MNLALRQRWWVKVFAAVAGVAVVLIVFLCLVDWNLLKRPLERFASARTGRAVTVAGNIRVHLWSRTPVITIERLRIANPPWEAAKPMVEVERLTVAVEMVKLLGGKLVLRRVELIHPHLYMHREKSGRANWTEKNTAPTDTPADAAAKFPAVRDITVEAGTLELVDDVRQLKLTGTLEGHEQDRDQGPAPFQLRAKGTINAEPFQCEIDGGPLREISPELPYPFSMNVIAGSNTVKINGQILKPFDLGELELEITASGLDLADLYHLTQLALPNSPPYRFQAHLHRAGVQLAITQIKGKYGQSDIEGKVDVDVSKKRPYVTAVLRSTHLFLDDFAALTGTQTGKSAKSRGNAAGVPRVKAPKLTTPALPRTIFPTARLQVDRLRAMNADVRFSATSIEAGKVPFTAVSLHARLIAGQLTIDPLDFVLPEGHVAAAIRIDATQRVPKVHINGQIAGIELDQFKSKPDATAPVQGAVQARGVIDGDGDSVHSVMAAANGSFSLVLPHGEIRAALPELTGIDVPEGVLLLLGRSRETAQIRCGVVHFNISDGRANADQILIDTENVLVTGHGQIDLSSEALDLMIQGHPKKLRLVRLRSPVELRGTLAQPAIRVEAGSLLKQGSVAVALGTLLTPLASILAFVDPGLAKDQNCAALLQSAGTQPIAPSPPGTSIAPKSPP